MRRYNTEHGARAPLEILVHGVWVASDQSARKQCAMHLLWTSHKDPGIRYWVPGVHDATLDLLVAGLDLPFRGMSVGCVIQWPERWDGVLAFAYQHKKKVSAVQSKLVGVKFGVAG